jgi:hypothetical protein
MTKNTAMRMPGKGCPAASQLVIQKPPTTKLHPRNLAKNTTPPADQLIKPIAEGSQIPIPSEPAPRPPLWITSQGATPAKRVPP